MPRQAFYEPQVGDTQQLEIRGFPVSIGGTYVLLDDVITALHAYADQFEDQDDANVHEAATWLQAGNRGIPMRAVEIPAGTAPPAPVVPDPDVNRIEVYPDDPESPRPRWIARAVDSTGKILHRTDGSFDQNFVVGDAQYRWPGAPVHLVSDFSHDTVWEENDPGGLRSVHTKRRRPSPNRLWQS